MASEQKKVLYLYSMEIHIFTLIYIHIYSHSLITTNDEEVYNHRIYVQLNLIGRYSV